MNNNLDIYVKHKAPQTMATGPVGNYVITVNGKWGVVTLNIKDIPQLAETLDKLNKEIKAEVTRSKGVEALLSEQLDGLSALVNVKNRTYLQSTFPEVSELTAGDLWFNSDNNYELSRWDGSTWHVITDNRLTESVQRLDELTGRVGRLESTTVLHTNRLSEIDRKLVDHQTQINTKASKDSLTLVEKRVTETEKGIIIQSERTDKVVAELDVTKRELELKANASAVETLSATVEQQGEDIKATAEHAVRLDTKIESINQELTLKADASVVNSLKTTVEKQGKDITSHTEQLLELKNTVEYQEGEINKKASAESVQKLTNDVSVINGKVTAQAEALTKLDTRVEENTAEISKKADASVLSKYYTKTEADTATAGKIEEFKSNLKVGGRNLVVGSQYKFDSATNNVASSTQFMYDLMYTADYIKTLSVDYADSVTLQFEWEYNGKNPSGEFSIQLTDAPKTVFATIPVSSTNKAGKSITTIKVPANWANSSGQKLSITRRNVDGFIRINKMQLELGVLATSWSYSDKDIDKGFEASAFALQQLTTEVTNMNGTIVSQGTSILEMRNDITSLNDNIKELATAENIKELTSRVEKNEQGISSVSKDLTSLKNEVTEVKDDLNTKASNQAVQELSSQVKKNKDDIEASSNSLTDLRSSILITKGLPEGFSPVNELWAFNPTYGTSIDVPPNGKFTLSPNLEDKSNNSYGKGALFKNKKDNYIYTRAVQAVSVGDVINLKLGVYYDGALANQTYRVIVQGLDASFNKDVVISTKTITVEGKKFFRLDEKITVPSTASKSKFFRVYIVSNFANNTTLELYEFMAYNITLSEINAKATAELTTKVTKNEEGIESISKDIVTLQNNIDKKADATAVQELKNQVTENKEGIKVLQTSTTELTSKVDANTKAIASKADTTALDLLKNEVKTNKDGIDVLQEKTVSLQSTLGFVQLPTEFLNTDANKMSRFLFTPVSTLKTGVVPTYADLAELKEKTPVLSNLHVSAYTSVKGYVTLYRFAVELTQDVVMKYTTPNTLAVSFYYNGQLVDSMLPGLTKDVTFVKPAKAEIGYIDILLNSVTYSASALVVGTFNPNKTYAVIGSAAVNQVNMTALDSLNQTTTVQGQNIKVLQEKNVELESSIKDKADASAVQQLKNEITQVDGKVTAVTEANTKLEVRVKNTETKLDATVKIVDTKYGKAEVDSAIAVSRTEMSASLLQSSINMISITKETWQTDTTIKADKTNLSISFNSSTFSGPIFSNVIFPEIKAGDVLVCSYKVQKTSSNPFNIGGHLEGVTVEEYYTNNIKATKHYMNSGTEVTDNLVDVVIKLTITNNTWKFSLQPFRNKGKNDATTMYELQLERGIKRSVYSPNKDDLFWSTTGLAKSLDETILKVTENEGKIEAVAGRTTKLETRTTNVEKDLIKKADASALNEYYTKSETNSAIASNITNLRASLETSSANIVLQSDLTSESKVGENPYPFWTRPLAYPVKKGEVYTLVYEAEFTQVGTSSLRPFLNAYQTIESVTTTIPRSIRRVVFTAAQDSAESLRFYVSPNAADANAKASYAKVYWAAMYPGDVIAPNSWERSYYDSVIYNLHSANLDGFSGVINDNGVTLSKATRGITLHTFDNYGAITSRTFDTFGGGGNAGLIAAVNAVPVGATVAMSVHDSSSNGTLNNNIRTLLEDIGASKLLTSKVKSRDLFIVVGSKGLASGNAVELYSPAATTASKPNPLAYRITFSRGVLGEVAGSGVIADVTFLNEAKVAEVDGKVIAQAKTISELKTELDGKASAKAVQDLSTTVEKQDGRITANSEANTKLQATIDTLTIGSTNLYTGTQHFTNTDWVNLKTGVTTTKYLDFTIFKQTWVKEGVCQNFIGLKDEQFVLSFYAKKSVAGIIAKIYGNNIVEDNTNFNLTTGWIRYSVRATVKAAGSFNIRIEKENNIAGDISFAGFKLERGIIPSDWSPAPIDVGGAEAIQKLEARVTETEKGITAQAQEYTKLNTKVDQNKATVERDYYTKTATDNAIAGAITSYDSTLTLGGTNLLFGTNSRGYVNYTASASDARLVWTNSFPTDMVTVYYKDKAIAGVESAAVHKRTTLVKGKTYTLSFLGQGTMAALNYCYIILPAGIDNVALPPIPLVESSINVRRSITFEWTRDSTDKASILMGCRVKEGDWFNFRGLMLEEATKPSSWSPNPNEIDDSLTANSKAITETITRVEKTESGIVALNKNVVDLNSSIDGINKSLGNKADAKALQELSTEVKTIDKEVKAQATSITNLRTDLSLTNKEVDKKASTEALNKLDTRVKTTETGLEAVSSDTTMLKATSYYSSMFSYAPTPVNLNWFLSRAINNADVRQTLPENAEPSTDLSEAHSASAGLGARFVLGQSGAGIMTKAFSKVSAKDRIKVKFRILPLTGMVADKNVNLSCMAIYYKSNYTIQGSTQTLSNNAFKANNEIWLKDIEFDVPNDPLIDNIRFIISRTTVAADAPNITFGMYEFSAENITSVAGVATALRETDAKVVTIGNQQTATAKDVVELKTRTSNVESGLTKKADASALNNYYTKSETNAALAGQISEFSSTLTVGGSNMLYGTHLKDGFLSWGSDRSRLNTYSSKGDTAAGILGPYWHQITATSDGTGAIGIYSADINKRTVLARDKVYTLTWRGQGTIKAMDYIYLITPSGSENIRLPTAQLTNKGGQSLNTCTFTLDAAAVNCGILIGSQQYTKKDQWFSVSDVTLNEGSLPTTWSMNSNETTEELIGNATAITETKTSVKKVQDNLDIEASKVTILEATNAKPYNLAIGTVFPTATAASTGTNQVVHAYYLVDTAKNIMANTPEPFKQVHMSYNWEVKGYDKPADVKGSFRVQLGAGPSTAFNTITISSTNLKGTSKAASSMPSWNTSNASTLVTRADDIPDGIYVEISQLMFVYGPTAKEWSPSNYDLKETVVSENLLLPSGPVEKVGTDYSRAVHRFKQEEILSTDDIYTLRVKVTFEHTGTLAATAGMRFYLNGSNMLGTESIKPCKEKLFSLPYKVSSNVNNAKRQNVTSYVWPTGTANATTRTVIHSAELYRGDTPVADLATSGAFAELTSTVTQQGNKLETASKDIVKINSRIDDPKTGLAAQAKATSDLTTRVKKTEDDITATSNNIVSLSSSIDSVDKKTSIIDTRSKNELPAYYWTNHAKQPVKEYKTLSVIGVNRDDSIWGSSAAVLTTDVPWGDPTGGPIRQIVAAPDGVYSVFRMSQGTGSDTSKYTWTAWSAPVANLTEGDLIKSGFIDEVTTGTAYLRHSYKLEKPITLKTGDVYTVKAKVSVEHAGTLTATQGLTVWFDAGPHWTGSAVQQGLDQVIELEYTIVAANNGTVKNNLNFYFTPQNTATATTKTTVHWVKLYKGNSLVTALASATQSLTTRVDKTEKGLESSATSITSLKAVIGARDEIVLDASVNIDEDLYFAANYAEKRNLTVVNEPTASGGKALKFGFNSGNNDIWAANKLNISYNPNIMYKFEARFKATKVTDGSVLIGIAARDADDAQFIASNNTTNGSSLSAQHYFYSKVPPLNEWVEFVGYMQGNSAGAQGGGGTLENPKTLAARAKRISPMFIANYQGKTGEVILDYVKITPIIYNKGGVNLVNTSLLEKGYYNPTTGDIVSSTWDRVDPTYYDCKPGDQFVAVVHEIGNSAQVGSTARMIFYNSSKARIGAEIIGEKVSIGKVYTLTAPANTAYYRYGTLGMSAKTMLERGTEPSRDWALAPADVASGSALNMLDVRVTETEEGVKTQANLYTKLNTQVGLNKSQIEIQGNSINGIEAQYGVTLTTDGIATGFQVISKKGAASQFIVQADRFVVASTKTNGKKPFIILTAPGNINGVLVPAGTYIDSAWIGKATIIDAQINSVSANKITVSDDPIIERVTDTNSTITGTSVSNIPSMFNDDLSNDTYTNIAGTPNGTETVYLQIDMKEVKMVGQILMYLYARDNRTYSFRIKGSKDGTNWEYIAGDSKLWFKSVPVQPGMDGTYLRNGTSSCSFTNGFGWSYRYIRIYHNGNDRNTSFHITQLYISSYAKNETIINGGNIITGSIEANKLSVNKLSAISSDLGDIKVKTANIDDLAVTTAKIANLAIGTTKIADAAITNAKIANLTVESGKIKDAAITTAKIANLAVEEGKIANLAVTNAKIANLAVNDAKIANLNASKITAGLINAARIQVGATSTFENGYNPKTATDNAATAQKAANDAATLAGNKGEVIYGNTAPTVAQRQTQNLWIDTTSNNNTPKRWNGSAWVVVTDKAATDAKAAADAANSTVNNWKFTGTTQIDGGKIRADTVTAVQIKVNELSAISANLGTFTTYKNPAKPTGARMIISGTLITVYDDNNKIRVKLGLWD